MSQKLLPSHIEQFNQWFQTQVRNGCPFCDARDWTIHDEMAVTSTVKTDTHSIDARHGAAVIQVTCNGCAFTASFSATRIGLIAAD